MKENVLKLFVLFSILIQLILAEKVFASEVDNLMQEGNNLYQKKQYEEAIDLYEQILARGYESDVLYYNLGNAYYRTGKMGYAVLNYERGLKLSPGDEDIEYNLDIAKVRTIDKIKEVPQIFLIEWWEVLLSSISTGSWSLIVLILYLMLLIFIGLYFTSRNFNLQRYSFYFGAISLAALTIAILLLIARVNRETTSTYGVLVESTIAVKQSPDEKSNDAFVIHEGVKFKVEDNVNNWAEIKLYDGKTGWLPLSSFETI